MDDLTEEMLSVYYGIQHYGGSFMQALADAMLRADPINLKKIKNTWPEEWQKYLKLGKEIENKDRKVLYNSLPF